MVLRNMGTRNRLGPRHHFASPDLNSCHRVLVLILIAHKHTISRKTKDFRAKHEISSTFMEIYSFRKKVLVRANTKWSRLNKVSFYNYFLTTNRSRSIVLIIFFSISSRFFF